MSGFIPVCWFCANKICSEQKEDGSREFLGCKKEPEIENYDDAKELCPLLKSKK